MMSNNISKLIVLRDHAVCMTNSNIPGLRELVDRLQLSLLPFSIARQPKPLAYLLPFLGLLRISRNHLVRDCNMWKVHLLGKDDVLVEKRV